MGDVPLLQTPTGRRTRCCWQMRATASQRSARKCSHTLCLTALCFVSADLNQPQGAPVLADEGERIAKLCSLGVLDTDADPRFDDITRLVTCSSTPWSSSGPRLRGLLLCLGAEAHCARH